MFLALRWSLEVVILIVNLIATIWAYTFHSIHALHEAIHIYIYIYIMVYQWHQAYYKTYRLSMQTFLQSETNQNGTESKLSMDIMA